jgi:hypothetical protein
VGAKPHLKTGVALGLSVHIGRAVVVAVKGAVHGPEILGKAALQVATTFEEGAVFHMGQSLPLHEARVLIREAEARFAERARVQLAAFVTQLGARVVAAGMAAAAPKALPPVESILKAHPLVHAAEGELYRRVFSAAAASLGVAPTRVPADTLAARAAAVAGLTPAKLSACLAAMGKASGKPWAADQKLATLAAWIALAG